MFTTPNQTYVCVTQSNWHVIAIHTISSKWLRSLSGCGVYVTNVRNWLRRVAHYNGHGVNSSHSFYYWTQRLRIRESFTVEYGSILDIHTLYEYYNVLLATPSIYSAQKSTIFFIFSNSKYCFRKKKSINKFRDKRLSEWEC